MEMDLTRMEIDIGLVWSSLRLRNTPSTRDRGSVQKWPTRTSANSPRNRRGSCATARSDCRPDSTKAPRRPASDRSATRDTCERRQRKEQQQRSRHTLGHPPLALLLKVAQPYALPSHLSATPFWVEPKQQKTNYALTFSVYPSATSDTSRVGLSIVDECGWIVHCRCQSCWRMIGRGRNRQSTLTTRTMNPVHYFFDLSSPLEPTQVIQTVSNPILERNRITHYKQLLHQSRRNFYSAVKAATSCRSSALRAGLTGHQKPPGETQSPAAPWPIVGLRDCKWRWRSFRRFGVGLLAATALYGDRRCTVSLSRFHFRLSGSIPQLGQDWPAQEICDPLDLHWGGTGLIRKPSSKHENAISVHSNVLFR